MNSKGQPLMRPQPDSQIINQFARMCFNREPPKLRAAKFRSGLLIAGLIPAILVSCGSLDRDGIGDVQQLTRSRIGEDISLPRTKTEQRDVDARIARFLKKPLTADGA